ncbi:MAG: SRPBCC family protein [Pseudomonadota bacterium]
MSRGLTVKVTTTVPRPSDEVFDHAAAMRPEALVQRRGPMPGIVRAEGAIPYTAVGDIRTLSMSDGNTLTETLTAIEPPSRYAYTVSSFAGWFAALATAADTTWFFEEADGATTVTWQVEFIPNGTAGRLFLPFVVQSFWPGFMAASLDRLKTSLTEDVTA